MKQHIKALQQISKASASAINVFKATETALKEQNAKMAETVSNIEEDIEKLENLKASLNDQERENTNILQSLQMFLGGKR